MNYTVIDKKKTKRKKKVNHYSDYKPILRIEANKKCVYCALDENPCGGYDHFHVEHFRPKSLNQFKSLLKDFNNLFYVCAICNRFKSNDWPNEPVNDHSIISYVDPKEFNYNEIFKINEDGKIEGLYTASKYMIEKINLNRPQLINERRYNLITGKAEKIIDEIKLMIDKIKLEKNIEKFKDVMIQLLELSFSTQELLLKDKEIPRYEPSEIKRK